MYPENWLQQRKVWNEQYPVRPVSSRVLRLDIELAYPCKRLSDVPVLFNPHRFGLDSRECFYVCADWSTIFDVWDIHGGHRMLVESCHANPWGERIRLMSTSCTIVHESWAHYKNWHDFAFFRGKFWKVVYNEYLGDWPGGVLWGLPFQDRRHLEILE